ncbi:MAG TPA: hypothetical protein VF399_11795 [bacterium]|jgi:hypothetical protein
MMLVDGIQRAGLWLGFFIMILVVSCNLLRKKEEKIITIYDVIPEAKVLSEVDGIIEYQGVRFYLGTGRLNEKMAYIDSLKLYELGDRMEVDMRFSRQIIIRTRQ